MMRKSAIKTSAGINRWRVSAGVVLAAAMAVGGSGAAFADATAAGLNAHCSFNIQTVNIQSNASGKVYHMVSGRVSERWDNKSSYTWRSSQTGYGVVANWGVISTGGIKSASTYCAV